MFASEVAKATLPDVAEVEVLAELLLAVAELLVVPAELLLVVVAAGVDALLVVGVASLLHADRPRPAATTAANSALLRTADIGSSFSGSKSVAHQDESGQRYSWRRWGGRGAAPDRQA
jgi:hypothetical protein